MGKSCGSFLNSDKQDPNVFSYCMTYRLPFNKQLCPTDPTRIIIIHECHEWHEETKYIVIPTSWWRWEWHTLNLATFPPIHKDLCCSWVNHEKAIYWLSRSSMELIDIIIRFVFHWIDSFGYIGMVATRAGCSRVSVWPPRPCFTRIRPPRGGGGGGGELWKYNSVYGVCSGTSKSGVFGEGTKKGGGGLRNGHNPNKGVFSTGLVKEMVLGIDVVQKGFLGAFAISCHDQPVACALVD